MKAASSAAALLAGLVAVLAGCETVRTPAEAVAPAASAEAPPEAPPTDPWTAERREVMELLAGFQRAGSLPADELRREYAAAGQAYARERSEDARLRLAMLLALPGTAFHDDARLLALLEAAASRTAPPESPRRQLVTLLTRHAGERARLAALAQRAEALHREEQTRAGELRKKLDALLKIDRDMRNRRRAVP